MGGAAVVMTTERVPQLHQLEAVDIVEVGHHVYSRTRKTSRDYPVGGLVWKVEPYADRETGEAGRRFHVIRGDDGRWVFDTIDGSDVDVDVLSPPRWDLVRSAVRETLPRQLMERQRSRKPWKREDLQLIDAMSALAAVMVPHG